MNDRVNQAAASSPPAPKAYLSRRYRLSASHRLHSDAYSDDQNRAAYGKCSTTENFTIEVYRIFAHFPDAKVTRVRIEETSNNSFEYAE
jgi:hypothetical protein